MVEVWLKRVEALPANRDQMAPPPEDKALVHVEMKIEGTSAPLQLTFIVAPLTTFDAAVADAEKQLAELGERIKEATQKHLLPLPKKSGMFDMAEGTRASIRLD